MTFSGHVNSFSYIGLMARELSFKIFLVGFEFKYSMLCYIVDPYSGEM